MNNQSTTVTNGQQKTKPNWVVMVYMIGGGDLTNAAVQSLQQLRSGASDDVVVVAQYDLYGEGDPRHIRRIKFKADTKETDLETSSQAIKAKNGITHPTTLQEFITEVVQQNQANKYVLFFWADAFVLTGGAPTDEHLAGEERSRPYMTPVAIGKALSDANQVLEKALEGEKVFDIIAMDACSMSMIEVAWEIRKYAHFMIASEKDVPDPGFQYDALLEIFKQRENSVADVCKQISRAYKRYYQEWIHNTRTGMKRVALSSVCLTSSQLDRLKTGLEELSQAIPSAATRDEVVGVRQNIKGSVGGLYVDLCNVCQELKKLKKPELTKVCDKICAIFEDNDFVIINEKDAKDVDYSGYKGLLCYWPYLTDTDRKELEDSLTRRATDNIPLKDHSTERVPAGKQLRYGLNAGNKGSLDIPFRGVHEMRRTLIRDTEEYYPKLALFKDDPKNTANWSRFIKETWPRWLAQKAEEAKTKREEPLDLDLRYSAQQCVCNLVKLLPPRPGKRLSVDGGGGSSTANQGHAIPKAGSRQEPVSAQQIEVS